MELKLSYVGTMFHGWQVQNHCISIQGILQDKLRRLLKDKSLKIVGSSRTDSGVHAHDQRVSFKTTSPIPTRGLQMALNSRLPSAIRVREVHERPNEFHARFHALGKHYAYFIYNGRTASPFVAPYLWECGYPLESDKMAEAARYFEGTRCFKALQAAGDDRQGSQTTIYTTRITRRGDLICFDVTGHHYLYHMVRNMVGSLVMVGRGEWSPEQMRERLDSGIRKQMGRTAPAQGLHLMEVFYEEPPFPFSPLSEALCQTYQFPGIP